ncbi:hypothetical protein EV715DRAFT_249568 [Schizophyllum commune]
MLRAIARAHALPRCSSRTFVSSVILTRNWESETVAQLKKEAKSRGLAMSGNKATLVMRIQQYERARANEALSPDVPAGARAASTSPAPAPSTTSNSATSAISGSLHIDPKPVSEAPGVPPEAQSTAPPVTDYLAVIIPDLSTPAPEPPTPIPHVPDFWGSAAAKSKPAPPSPEEELPKIVVVADASTHIGGVTHNLTSAEEEVLQDVSYADYKSGVLSDMAKDLGLPPLADFKKGWEKVRFW